MFVLSNHDKVVVFSNSKDPSHQNLILEMGLQQLNKEVPLTHVTDDCNIQGSVNGSSHCFSGENYIHQNNTK